MEIIHQILIESTAKGFWTFSGYILMVGLIIGLPAQGLTLIVQTVILLITKRRK